LNLSLPFDITSGVIEGHAQTERRLGDLPTAFADPKAVCSLLNAGNPILYRVSQIEDHNGPGQLHYGMGILMPGKVGQEYFMTKGHFHAWRPAAEVYIGLAGQGLMLLEHEETGECSAVPLAADTVVYVPGYTAHRTVNTGSEPLVYWGVFPSDAGHDYGSVGKRNFRQVVVEENGQPVVKERVDFLAELGVQQ